MIRESTLLKITQKHPLHMTGFPIQNPAQLLLMVFEVQRASQVVPKLAN